MKNKFAHAFIYLRDFIQKINCANSNISRKIVHTYDIFALNSGILD